MPVTRKYERDIDLFLAEEFSCSPSFADWFLGHTKFANTEAVVTDVFVSASSDNLGESDLVVLFERLGGGRFALLIEDKIDAPLQPDQEARYRERGYAEVSRGGFDDFTVVLCSPMSYRTAIPSTSTFDSFVSYEQIGDFVRLSNEDRRAAYRADFVEKAASRSASAWVKINDDVTNKFWDAAYKVAAKDYPDLEMKPLNVTKGSTWINFRPADMPTMPQRIYISFKGDRGFIDLTFNGSVAADFRARINSLLDEDMTVHQTGKSAAIRIHVQGFEVSEAWDTVEPRVRGAFQASERLIRFFRSHRKVLSLAAAQSLPSNPLLQ